MSIQNIKNFINQLNSYGIPLPMLRINGVSTLTGTMAFLAFNTCLLGQLSKVTHLIGAIDLQQSNYLFGLTLAAYLGRRIQTNSSTKTIDMGDSK